MTTHIMSRLCNSCEEIHILQELNANTLQPYVKQQVLDKTT